MGVVLVVALLASPALVAVLLDGRLRRSKVATWSGIAEVGSGTACRGYKVAQLVVDERRGTAWLSGVTGRAYAVDVAAQCPRRRCRPPGLDCVCGFYAWRDRSRALELLDELGERHPRRGYALLTVDLDGSVLEYEHGYRAARQRVHRIELPGTCQQCDQADGAPPEPAVATLVADPTQRVEQGLGEHAAPLGSGLARSSAVVRAVCSSHAPTTGVRRLDLSTLRGLVGTEVDLLPTRAR